MIDSGASRNCHCSTIYPKAAAQERLKAVKLPYLCIQIPKAGTISREETFLRTLESWKLALKLPLGLREYCHNTETLVSLKTPSLKIDSKKGL